MGQSLVNPIPIHLHLDSWVYNGEGRRVPDRQREGGAIAVLQRREEGAETVAAPRFSALRRAAACADGATRSDGSAFNG